MDELIFSREFERVAELHGHRRASLDVGHGVEVSFDHHRSRVHRLASAMRSRLSLDRSDRFAVLMGNRHEYGELWHAGLSGGGVINPLNSRAHPDDICFMLEDSGAEVVFADAEYAPVIESVRSRLPRLRCVVGVGDIEGPFDVGYDDLLVSGSADERAGEPSEDDVAVLMYTGGTTGRPKGVVITQRGLMLNWHRITETIRPTHEWSTLQVVPMFHVGSFVSLTMTHLAGGAIAYVPRWDPGTALDVIERYGLTALPAVPSMAVQMIEHPAFAPERIRTLRYFGYGGSPMSEGLLRRLIEVLPAEAMIVQSYGLTETCGMVTVLDTDDHRRVDAALLRSVGRRMPGFDVSVREVEGGGPVPTGEVGEVCLRSGSVMREYWNRPVETAEVLDGGWLRTGDMGYQDGRGYLWLTDRAKDMIISGGENVFSIEVENAVSTHPAVSQVAVIGIPHDVWGESVHAVVRLVDGATATDAEIMAHARRTLAPYKVPRSVTFRDDDFPLSPAGKVRKDQLRRQAEPSR
jgi:acyl-CoA synthetase (AMP-forming)/AMP-acid ligase II